MYKLLLVDDEPIIREGLERIIDWEKLDLKLTASCPNAIAALDSMTDDMPDILLTDIRLPGMTGLELVQRAVTLHPMLLVDSFNALRESEADAEQLEKQVGELVKTVEDPSLLQETLVAVVIGCMGAGQAEWGMNIITDALHDRRSLEELISRTLLRLRREGSAARSNDFVQQIISYTSVHYADESLSLQYLADKVVYMNADYIGREFTRAMGQKFSSYLLGIRMEHAKSLMRADRSLHSYEIAEKVGLGDNPHYFSQLFRKYTGTTPKDYRRFLDEQPGRPE